MSVEIWDTLHSVATLISLGLTVPALVICFLVLKAWRGEYRRYCVTTERTASQYLIAGVYIGFFGSMVDNAWWGLAWTFHFLDHPLRAFYFENGVFTNSLFRQWALIWAGALHVHAENMSKATQSEIKRSSLITTRTLAASGVLGLAYVVGLFFARKFGVFV